MVIHHEACSYQGLLRNNGGKNISATSMRFLFMTLSLGVRPFYGAEMAVRRKKSLFWAADVLCQLVPWLCRGVTFIMVKLISPTGTHACANYAGAAQVRSSLKISACEELISPWYFHLAALVWSHLWLFPSSVMAWRALHFSCFTRAPSVNGSDSVGPIFWAWPSETHPEVPWKPTPLAIDCLALPLRASQRDSHSVPHPRMLNHHLWVWPGQALFFFFFWKAPQVILLCTSH